MTSPGRIGWIDLTVPDAEGVRSFYEAVVGWTASPVEMGGYSDYAMTPAAGGDAVTGICHARGSNEGLPPVWMIYIVVEDIEAALAACTAHGGAVVRPSKKLGGSGWYAMIRDPAGAHVALWQNAQ
jgi:predicted enzyme related to lactoylglutathione lyase